MTWFLAFTFLFHRTSVTFDEKKSLAAVFRLSLPLTALNAYTCAPGPYLPWL